MSIFSGFLAKKALILQSKNKVNEAHAIYEELLAKGKLKQARYLLAYSVLLIKKYEFRKAKEIILMAEKCNELSDEQKKQIYIYYAICLFKLGEKGRAIQLLEKEHRNRTSGLLQQTLGYFYIENNAFEDALAYITESLEYDDEDSIVLDNMGQYYYRKPEPNKEKALYYFKKAIQIKPNQIDTLYFLALYDIENQNYTSAIEKLETALKGNFSPLNYVNPQQLNKMLMELKNKVAQ